MALQTYRVNFYREICNSIGRRASVRIDSIDIESTGDIAEATALGIVQFNQRHRLRDWGNFAHRYKVKLLADPDDLKPAHRAESAHKRRALTLSWPTPQSR